MTTEYAFQHVITTITRQVWNTQIKVWLSNNDSTHYDHTPWLTFYLHSSSSTRLEAAGLTNLFHVDSRSPYRTTVTKPALVVPPHLYGSSKEALTSLAAYDSIMASEHCIGRGYVATDNTPGTTRRTGLCAVGVAVYTPLPQGTLSIVRVISRVLRTIHYV